MSLLNKYHLSDISFCEQLITDEFLDAEITREEFDRAVDGLNDNKAAGEDRIPVECYKYGPDCLKEWQGVYIWKQIYNYGFI